MSAKQRSGRGAGPAPAFFLSLPAAALSQERTAIDSPAGSIPRNAPAEAGTSAEDNVRRRSGASSESPCRCRNRRSGIQGIAGTKPDRESSSPRYTSGNDERSKGRQTDGSYSNPKPDTSQPGTRVVS